MMAASEDTEAAKRALQTDLQRLQSDDPFQALGLSSSAGFSELKQRYGELVARLHPHHYVRFDSPELKELATKAFIRLQHVRRECHELLQSRQLTRGHPQLATASGRGPAERSMSKALQMMELHQYDAAAEIIARSLQVDPRNLKLLAFRHRIDARRCESADDAQGAYKAYVRLLKMAPDDEEALQRIETISARKRTEATSTGFFRRLFKAGKG